MRIRIGGRIVLILVVMATIGCDRVTKHAATMMLSGSGGHSYFADTVRFGYVENPGGFLSLGANLPAIVRTAFFTIGTGALLLALGIVAVRRSREGWSALGLALFCAGGASNWIDRVARGSVVDFLNVGLGSVRTGVFNVADVAIMVGAGIFVLAEFLKGRTLSSSAGTGRPA
jgi:signal peptidase II